MKHEFNGKFVNFEDERISGKVLAVIGDTLFVTTNWQQLDLFAATKRAWGYYKWPALCLREIDRRAESLALSTEPKYTTEVRLELLNES